MKQYGIPVEAGIAPAKKGYGEKLKFKKTNTATEQTATNQEVYDAINFVVN
tara:strand:- start:161 stop:313 length:153 start_codon:yes stop_codon:yes gene_type:complete